MGVPSRGRAGLRSGRSLDRLDWYEALALWKAAVFLECSFACYRRGDTDDDYFATLGEGVPALARAALRRVP